MRRFTLTKLAAGGVAVALMTTGCLGGGGGGGGGGGAPAGGAGDKKVDILGAFGGPEGEAFKASMKEFESSSGITISYSASTDFTTIIRSRVAAANVPDIALFPQPGLLLDIARQNKLTDLATVVDLNKIKSTLVPAAATGFLDATTIEGKVYGVPMRMAVKSLVWHPVPEFEQKGYTAPKSQAELLALNDKIKSDGGTPWCVGIESGQASGWPATDWLEEYVLRIGGPEKYDQWWKHEIPFNDPVVKQAAQEFEKVALADGNVAGGRKAVSSNAFQTAANPMFSNPPGCYMHRQGNFILTPGFFPKAVSSNPDANVATFPLPSMDGGPAPVLLGGDLAAVFKTDDDVKKVMEFLSSDQFGGAWAKAGGWLSPHKTFDASQYPNDVTRGIVEGAAAAQVGRFDASDLMPGAVGAGSFWRGMVAWVSGQKDLDTALNEIEASWPK
jgi:alpha-glucoside transport system substrate-binding protein